jgi:glycine/D-amino acid oxidase-like deaminating enzyme
VIIGGGAVGCGIAYALAKAGKTDVLVVERRAGLAQGTTSQGAGLCGQVRTTAERTRLAMYSAKTFAELQATNAPAKPDWHEVGSLRLATNSARATELQRLAEVCRDAGLEVELIDASRAQKLWPRLSFEGVILALWCPSDGYMSPAQVARTYEYYCREYGVRFLVDAEAESIELRNGRVTAVRTNRGLVECKYAVNAAGPHAYHVARMVGLELPIVPVRHQYYVTSAISGLEPSFPVLRIPDVGLYARVDNGGLLLGGWESNCVSLVPNSYRNGESEPALEADWEVLKDFTKRFTRFLPEVASASAARVAKGWPTFTPDGRFIVGKSGLVPGFVMAAACNAHGISGSPGLGQAFIESMFSTNPSAYVRSLNPDRFAGTQWTWQAARDQAESLCRNYYETVLSDDATTFPDVERRFDPSDTSPLERHVRAPQAAPDIVPPRSK